MELIKVSWFILFFLFALTLLLVWAKTFSIVGKVKRIEKILGDVEAIDAQHEEMVKAAAAARNT